MSLKSRPSDDLSGADSFETIIRPSGGWAAINWPELMHSHELFMTLVSRDIKIRYKQTVLGVAWAVIQPLLTMAVFAVIFGRMAGVNSGDVPYPLFVFAGLVPWMFFFNAAGAAGGSLLSQQQLLTKVYFPRMYVPASAVGGFLVDLGIGLLLLAILLPIYHRAPGWGLLALPLVVSMTFMATLGISLTLSAATLLYRDLRFVIPFGLQMMMFVSPVIYRADQFRPLVRYTAAINPMFGIINAYRSSILGMPWDLGPLAVSVASTSLVTLFGLFFFRKTERMIADIV